MAAAGRFLVALPILLALGWAAMNAWRATVVDAAQVSAAKAYRSWTESLPPLLSWQVAWNELQAAREAEAANPVTAELLGLLAARRPDDPALMTQARELFRSSLQRRPASPRTWANLVEAKYLAGEAPASIEPALLVATRLGRSEPHVQRIVANYGLALWDEAAPATRAAIDASLAAGMRRNPLEMLQIADRRGRLSVACRHIAGPLEGAIRPPDPKILRLCPSRETPR